MRRASVQRELVEEYEHGVGTGGVEAVCAHHADIGVEKAEGCHGVTGEVGQGHSVGAELRGKTRSERFQAPSIALTNVRLVPAVNRSGQITAGRTADRVRTKGAAHIGRFQEVDSGRISKATPHMRMPIKDELYAVAAQEEHRSSAAA